MLNRLYKRTVELTKPSALKTDLDSGNKVLILDTREKSEYQVSHILTAKFAGYKKFDKSIVDGVSKDTKIVIYCSVGYRSERIGEQLKALGFNNVYNLYGGIFKWVNDGNSVVNSKGEQTQEVHAYSKKWGKWLRKGEKIY